MVWHLREDSRDGGISVISMQVKCRFCHLVSREPSVLSRPLSFGREMHFYMHVIQSSVTKRPECHSDLFDRSPFLCAAQAYNSHKQLVSIYLRRSKTRGGLGCAGRLEGRLAGPVYLDIVHPFHVSSPT